jgi:glycosyl transferase family 1/glycosyl transferase family 2
VWMCTEIWPKIRARRPDAQLCIVGRDGSDELRRIVTGAGGVFHEDVPDIRPYYWEAAAVVACVRMGSGTRNKVLHGMACGAPVVATPSAIEGMEVTNDHLWIASDAEAIAHAVVEVLNDPAAASARARAGRDVAAGYTARAAGSALENWWERSSPPERRPPALAAPETRASVVLATRERPSLLRRSLAAVAAAAAEVPGTEIIVVEQGTPSAAAICSELGVSADVVPDPGVGVSRARNIGVARAGGDVVLFTDDDCEVPTSWVRDHLDAFAYAGLIASCGPVTGIGSYDEEQDPVALPIHHRRGDAPWQIGHSSNMAVRADAVRAAGGFDERMGPGMPEVTAAEDADLIVRLLALGPVASGTGEATRHIDWRSSEDQGEALLSYEHGAGAWIGKSFRARPAQALRYLAARRKLLRQRAELVDGAAVSPRALARAFRRGLLAGVRLGTWKGGRAVSSARSPRAAGSPRGSRR